ncbi:MAG TPA: hypothetical protein VFD58_04995 [Blastocatellia bacterium]|nr:hypothetical protein [Blastocatellia bacterium]
MTIRTDMKMKYLSAISGFGKALCLSLLLLAAASVPAFAQADVYGAWTSVGSTGTVDEADAANVGFNATQVYLTAGATSATIRYNVTATSNLFFGLNKTLVVRAFKPNADSRIIINLLKQDLNSGAVVGIGGMDSGAQMAWIASPSFQVRSTPLLASQFDFLRNSYYIEVQLIRTAPTGDPRVSMLQVFGN